MSRYDSLRSRIGLYWFVLGGVLVLQGIVHGLAASPAFVIAWWAGEEFVPYAIYAWVGWIVLHSIDTFTVIRFLNAEELASLFERGNFKKATTYFAFSGYLNIVLLLAMLLGYGATVVTDVSALGLLVVLIYANFDLRLGVNYNSPAGTLLDVIIKPIQILGAFQGLSGKSIMQSIEPRQESVV